MAGNSQRRGAVRKGKSKKGATVGSGGRGKQGLEGKGPTPKAEDRTKHIAAKRKRAAEKRAGTRAPRERRQGDSAEWAAGRNSVLEAMRAGVPATAVYVQQYLDGDDRVKEILELAVESNIALLECSKGELDRNTDGAVHQGVAMRIPPYDYADPIDLLNDAPAESPLFVALDGVTDPRNLGAVIRSAAAFGADGVVIPERRAAGMTASAWKTSAGAAARVRVARAVNLNRTLSAYHKAGCTIIGLDMDGDCAVAELDPDLANGPIVLVVGSEGSGMSRLVREACDVVVEIPMVETTESLNAGVAAGIALYELAKLRGN